VQIGDADTAYVIPAGRRTFITSLLRLPMNWIGHNGTHDIRSIDTWLGFETGVSCAGETYIPAHYKDPRKQEEGGTGHGLKELSIAYVAPDAGKWEYALKKAFKEILIPVPGEVYKSGPRKGQQKLRKAKLGEGWGLIPAKHPAYIAYSAADPLLTYRLWRYLQPMVHANLELYHNDLADQWIADKLHRRAMRLDVRYATRLSAAFAAKSETFIAAAAEFGCANINSGKQVADTLLRLGVELHARTPSGQYKTDDGVLRSLLSDPRAADFIHAVLGAKQVLKRRENYTEAFLREMDAEGRVHPSINTMAARTTRMSISNPPLQQLPTKDREEDAQ
jgi:DNA polymerase-1